jgi:hypothetical protein
MRAESLTEVPVIGRFLTTAAAKRSGPAVPEEVLAVLSKGGGTDSRGADSRGGDSRGGDSRGARSDGSEGGGADGAAPQVHAGEPVTPRAGR